MNIKQRKLGWQYGAGAAVLAASVGALILARSCAKPEPENIITECPDVKPVEKPKPPKKDGKCEVDKGEHDPFSKVYSKEDCGYCGDGIQNVPWETAENCEVDFLCGNGKVDYRSKTYGGIVENEGSYSYGLINYSESCVPSSENYCESDCPGGNPKPTGKVPGKVQPAPDKPAVTPVKQPPLPSGQCPPGIQDSTLRSRVASNISSNSAQIRAAAGGGSAPMTAFVSVNISGSGVPTIAGSSVRCGSSSCPSPVSPASVSSLSLGGIVVGGMGGSGCSKTYGATVR